MNTLQNALESEGYTSISFHYTFTNHIEITASINKVEGTFIVDTGASNSFVSNNFEDKFRMQSEKNEDADVIGIGKDAPSATLISHGNSVSVETFELLNFSFALLEMGHINEALSLHNARQIDGVIGGDFLEQTKAIIDYSKRLIWFKNV